MKRSTAFSTRELVILAVFGALWGVIEMGLGSLLHALRIPLSGLVLAAAGLGVALIGRLFVPRRGATLFIGMIALLLKLFSIGSVVLGPMIGITAEALIAELVLSIAGRPSRASFCAAAGLGVLWTLVQPFFTGLLFFGREALVIWLDLVDEGSRLFGLSSSAALWILLVLVALRLLAGGVAGWLAWQAGRLLRQRLGDPAFSTVPRTGPPTYLLLILCLVLTACAGAAPAAPAVEETVLKISGGSTSKSYTVSQLSALEATQADFRGITYVGVQLAVLLKDAGFDPGEISAVKAVASDGFTVNYAPTHFNQTDTLVVYATPDGALPAEDGTFRMVLPAEDGKLNPRQLVEIQVIQ